MTGNAAVFRGGGAEPGGLTRLPGPLSVADRRAAGGDMENAETGAAVDKFQLNPDYEVTEYTIVDTGAKVALASFYPWAGAQSSIAVACSDAEEAQ
jgi:hypothetical protein